MDCLTHFLEQNKIYVDLLASVGTLLAAFFAYLSARSSSLVGRMPYVPIITILSPKVYEIENKSSFSIVNNSESSNAVARSVILNILGKDYFYGDIKPSFENRIDFNKNINVTSQNGEIRYKDIFNRDFKVKFKFGPILFRRSEIEDRATNVDVVLNYQKLHI